MKGKSPLSKKSLFILKGKVKPTVLAQKITVKRFIRSVFISAETIHEKARFQVYNENIFFFLPRFSLWHLSEKTFQWLFPTLRIKKDWLAQQETALALLNVSSLSNNGKRARTNFTA